MIYAASVGNLAAVLDGVHNSTRGASTWGTIDGAGGAFNQEDARLLSIAEGVERYASCVYDEAQFIWATARELGSEAVDLTQFPSVSEAENKRTPAWIPPDADSPIRWVKSICMMTGTTRWIPAMSVYLHLPYASVGERFTVPLFGSWASGATSFLENEYDVYHDQL
ncbi:YcaO-like family protein [Corynebacterium spheniscorum]